MTLQLYIGNKNYSSWSLRPWLLMRELGIEFEEVRLRLDFADASPFRRALAQLGPIVKVPVLVDGGFAVWDTLAIVEYLHERQGGASVWPADAHERARARSLCAEMHSGFSDLRTLCPMNIEADLRDVGVRLWAESDALRRDVARIETLWTPQLESRGHAWLFGRFSAVDAYFAPVCSRLRTYGLPLSAAVASYVERVWFLPAMQQWARQAVGEHDFLPFDEPYREPPAAA